MSSEYESIRFSDLLTSAGTRNGIYKSKEFHGRGAKIVNMGELFAHPRLFNIEMKRIEINCVEEEKFSLKEGDLLFARRSLVAEGAGKCSIVKEVESTTVFESSIIRARVDRSKASSDYLYYTFSSVVGRNLLGTILRQTAVSGITGTELVELEIPLPPIAKQKAIAHILGTLDDKIELNRKTNETLEAMAKALFKSWFVDFDPVRAKAEGRPTGLPADISDLFPDSFEDSELGEIPSGWEVFSLGQMLDTISETLPLNEREKVVFLNTGDILNGEFLVSERVSSRGLPGQAKKSIRKGDILFSEIRPGNGRHAFVYFDAHDYVVSTKLMVLRSRSRSDSLFEYFLITLSSSIQILRVLAESRSGTFPQITFSELSSIKYPLPVCRGLIDVFDAQFLRLFHERSMRLRHQNILLSQARDTLLPKLISGEIRVPDAEKMLEEVLS